MFGSKIWTGCSSYSGSFKLARGNGVPVLCGGIFQSLQQRANLQDQSCPRAEEGSRDLGTLSSGHRPGPSWPAAHTGQRSASLVALQLCLRVPLDCGPPWLTIPGCISVSPASGWHTSCVLPPLLPHPVPPPGEEKWAPRKARASPLGVKEVISSPISHPRAKQVGQMTSGKHKLVDAGGDRCPPPCK